MRAVVHDRYGGPEVLRLEDAIKPEPRDREVLIRVHAVSLNPADEFMMRGQPWPVRLAMGLGRPRGRRVIGYDLAGVVEAVGTAVTRFQPGDEVYGSTASACADYVFAREGVLARRPANLGFQEAAAVPMAGLAALHGLRDAARLTRGQRLLINGASGGIGTFAVQIARLMGATVTGVCSTPNVELVRQLGAERVIDYTNEDFTRGGDRYDVILDNVGNRRLEEFLQVLAPRGTLLTNSGRPGPEGGPLARMARAGIMNLFSRHSIKGYYSATNAADLGVLAAWCESGEVRPVIDEVFPLERVAEAMERVVSGHARGKVVVAVAE